MHKTYIPSIYRALTAWYWPWVLTVVFIAYPIYALLVLAAGAVDGAYGFSLYFRAHLRAHLDIPDLSRKYFKEIQKYNRTHQETSHD